MDSRSVQRDISTPIPDSTSQPEYLSPHAHHFSYTPQHTVSFAQHHNPQNRPTHNLSTRRTDPNEHPSPKPSAPYQDLHRSNIVDGNRPPHRRRGARQVVLPDYQQDREQLRAGADQQRGGERVAGGEVCRCEEKAQRGREGGWWDRAEESDG
ncbi:hypothetical protein PSPO01_15930 [Paraphaeosphaeria sporulosa]